MHRVSCYIERFVSLDLHAGDTIFCIPGYTKRSASLDLHAGDAKFCVSTKSLHLQMPTVKPNYYFQTASFR